MKLHNINISLPDGNEYTLNGELEKNGNTFSLTVNNIDIIGKLANIIGNAYETAVNIFFNHDELDLSDNEDIDEDELENLITAIEFGDKFTDISKAIAIKEFTGAAADDIEEISSDEFEISGDGNYLVLTDDEADEAALEREKDLLDDIGIEGMSDWAQKHIIDNYVDTDWFDSIMHDYNYSYAEDLINDSASSYEYVNAAHEKMVNKGILSEPEWPDEDDFEYDREDFDLEEFDEEEPDSDDFDTDEEYEEAYEAWEQDKSDFEDEQEANESDWNEEQDRSEEEAQERYEDAVNEYRDELESEVENNLDELATAFDEDWESGIEYYKSNFGDEETMNVIKSNNLIDMDDVAQYIIDEDGRGSILATYDGNENVENITYNGEEYEYYIYHL